MLALSAILGLPLMGGILKLTDWIGDQWWLWAWGGTVKIIVHYKRPGCPLVVSIVAFAIMRSEPHDRGARGRRFRDERV
jgi:hypothetical protein